MRKTSEPSSLKSLASNVLERLQRNKVKVQESKHFEKSVLYNIQGSSSQSSTVIQLSSLPEEYEERLAIAEYDGHQTSTQAERIAYLDAFVSVLLTLPYDDGLETNMPVVRATDLKSYL